MFDFQRVKGIVIESRYPVGYFNDWAHIIQKGICLMICHGKNTMHINSHGTWININIIHSVCLCIYIYVHELTWIILEILWLYTSKHENLWIFICKFGCTLNASLFFFVTFRVPHCLFWGCLLGGYNQRMLGCFFTCRGNDMSQILILWMGTQWGLAYLFHIFSGWKPPATMTHQRSNSPSAQMAKHHWHCDTETVWMLPLRSGLRLPTANRWRCCFSVWTWGIDPQNSCGKIIINQAIWECPIFRKKTSKICVDGAAIWKSKFAGAPFSLWSTKPRLLNPFWMRACPYSSLTIFELAIDLPIPITPCMSRICTMYPHFGNSWSIFKLYIPVTEDPDLTDTMVPSITGSSWVSYQSHSISLFADIQKSYDLYWIAISIINFHKMDYIKLLVSCHV